MATASSRYIFDILRLISGESRPVSATEISRRLGLPTTTAHRGLLTLERAGYVARHQLSARYVPGPMSRRLLQSFFARFALHGFAIPYLRQFAIATGETISLFVPVGWYAVRIASVKGTNEIIHTGPIGEVRDLDDGAAGRALLAFAAAADRRRFLAEARQDLSAKRRSALEAELAGIRRRGFATQERASGQDLAALAFPLRSAEGAALGTIAIEGAAPEHGDGDIRRRPEWADLVAGVARMEALIHARPDRFSNPYGHLDPATIRLPSVTQRTAPHHPAAAAGTAP